MPPLNEQQQPLLGEGEGAVGNRGELTASGFRKSAEPVDAIGGEVPGVIPNAISRSSLAQPADERMLAENEHRVMRERAAGGRVHYGLRKQLGRRANRRIIMNEEK